MEAESGAERIPRIPESVWTEALRRTYARLAAGSVRRAELPVAARGGVVLYTDNYHITRGFSRSLGPVLGERLDAALRH